MFNYFNIDDNNDHYFKLNAIPAVVYADPLPITFPPKPVTLYSVPLCIATE